LHLVGRHLQLRLYNIGNSNYNIKNRMPQCACSKMLGKTEEDFD